MDSGEEENISNLLWYWESMWQSQQRKDTWTTRKHGNTGKNDGDHKELVSEKWIKVTVGRSVSQRKQTDFAVPQGGVFFLVTIMVY